MFLYFPPMTPDPPVPPLPEERLAILVRRWWRWLSRAAWRARRRRTIHPKPAAPRPGDRR